MLSFLKNIQALYRIKESYGHTNSILKAIVGVLTTLEKDVKDITLEGCILTARGMWLDEWGRWVGVNRYSKESDDTYRGRILTKLKNSSSTIEALKINSANFYNSKENSKWKYNKDDWVITENWIYINLLSVRGSLSHDFVFPDKDYYNWCTIQIFSPEDVTPEYKELIETIKAAGIKVYYTQDLFPRTYLKVVDWYTTYRAHLMYFIELNKNSLNGNFSGILEYTGKYSGVPLFLSSNTNIYNEIKNLEFLKQVPIEEKNNILRRLEEVYSFYHRGGYNTNQGILFHLSYIFGKRFTGILEDSFLQELGTYITYTKTHRAWLPLLTLVTLFIIDYRKSVHLLELSEETKKANSTLTELGRAYSIQDWWSSLYTLEDAMNFYPSEPLYGLDFAPSMHLTKVHGYNSKIF